MSSPTKRRPAVILVDPTTLSDETKAILRAKARATVQAEVEAASADALYQELLEEERRKLDPQEETKYITLDMAGHADRIMMDGTIFFHGVTYAMSKSKYDSIRDIVARGHDHESEIGFANRGRNITPRQHNAVLSAKHPIPIGAPAAR